MGGWDVETDDSLLLLLLSLSSLLPPHAPASPAASSRSTRTRCPGARWGGRPATRPRPCRGRPRRGASPAFGRRRCGVLSFCCGEGGEREGGGVAARADTKGERNGTWCRGSFDRSPAFPTPPPRPAPNRIQLHREKQAFLQKKQTKTNKRTTETSTTLLISFTAPQTAPPASSASCTGCGSRTRGSARRRPF